MNNMPAKLDQLLQFLKLTPNEPFILFALAKEYENLAQRETALEYYTQLVKNHPNYVGTYYHLGKLHEQQQDFRKAFYTYQKGMDVARNQGDQHALSELAGAKLNLGDAEEFEE